MTDVSGRDRVAVGLQLTIPTYRRLAMIADRNSVQVHHLIERWIDHTLDPANGSPARRAKKRRWTDHDVAELRILNAAGMSDTAIARQLGHSQSWTWALRRDLGLEPGGTRSRREQP